MKTWEEIALGYVKRGFNTPGANLDAFASKDSGAVVATRWNWFRFPFAKAERPVLREVFVGQFCRRHIWFVISLPFDNCAILNLAF